MPTFAPSRAKRWAIARPIPRDAPVIKTTGEVSATLSPYLLAGAIAVFAVDAAQRLDAGPLQAAVRAERERPQDRLASLDVAHHRPPERGGGRRRVHPPVDDRRAPAQSGAEAHQRQVRAGVDASGLDCLAERDGDRGRRGV